MKKIQKIYSIRIIVLCSVMFLFIAVYGLYMGNKYISNRLLQADESAAVDTASLVADRFTISDDEVSYMKSLSFNEMEKDPINHRLMEMEKWGKLNCHIKNVYIIAGLSGDEIKYTVNRKQAEFFGYETGTKLDGIWLLNGIFNDKGVFQETERDDICRYTLLNSDERDGLDKQKSFGTYSSDTWGSFITGYAPVYTEEGTFVGLLGVDMQLDKYQSNAKVMLMIMLIIFGTTTVAIAVLFFCFFTKYVKSKKSIYEEREKKYMRLVERMGNNDDERIIAKGRYDITTNEVLFFNRRGEKADIPVGSSYDEAIVILGSKAVSDVKCEEICKILHHDKLLEDYRLGIKEGKIEFARRGNNDMVMWSMIRYTLFEEPKTGDIIAFIYTYDISDSVMERQILSGFGNAEYEALGLLDVENGHYSVKKVTEEIEGPAYALEGDFMQEAKARIESLVVEIEREDVREEFKIENILESLKDKLSYSIDYSIVCGVGQIKRKKYTFSYLDETGKIIMYYRSDITEQYNREKKQLHKTEEALELAKEANRAKSEFLSRMSHDIRTPMNTIVNLTSIVKSELDDKEMALQDLNKIETSNQFLLSLINDILDMSRIEDHKMEMHPDCYRHQEFYNYIQSTFEPMAKEKNIQFTVDVDNTNVDLIIDKVRFNQMCSNLISNAIKYTEEGGNVEFAFHVAKVSGNIMSCDIYITDDGIGMSDEFQMHMFEPFVQEGRTFRPVEGTGLGLSIVKEIVKMLGGTISVKSKIGSGTSFHINLDIEFAEKRLDETEIHNKDYDILKGKHVLMAEDHPLNQEIARRLLTNIGMEVDVVDNGLEAVETFTEHYDRYDAILMDMRMPVMDGFSATEKIRNMELDRARTIPIIAMTANAFAEDREQSAKIGMDAHIAKPIDPELLYEVLIQMIDK